MIQSIGEIIDEMKPETENMEMHIIEFVYGLLKRAKVKHAGNCLVMCEVLQEYLLVFWRIRTLLKNCQVKRGSESVNHYYLEQEDGTIIDPTACQFEDQNGKQMPQVYFGKLPTNYLM